MLNIRKQTGVGLIEVLITMLVLAVGLLGLAALQNSALRFSHTATLESQAQFLARDIIDSMRVVGKPEQELFVIDFSEPAPSAGTNCKSTNCSSETALANWLLREWRNNVDALLPNNEVEIKRINTTTNEYSITIRYDDLRGEVPADTSITVPKREVRVVTRI